MRETPSLVPSFARTKINLIRISPLFVVIGSIKDFCFAPWGGPDERPESDILGDRR